MTSHEKLCQLLAIRGNNSQNQVPWIISPCMLHYSYYYIMKVAEQFTKTMAITTSCSVMVNVTNGTNGNQQLILKKRWLNRWIRIKMCKWGRLMTECWKTENTPLDKAANWGLALNVKTASQNFFPVSMSAKWCAMPPRKPYSSETTRNTDVILSTPYFRPVCTCKSYLPNC